MSKQRTWNDDLRRLVDEAIEAGLSVAEIIEQVRGTANGIKEENRRRRREGDR